MFTRFRKQWNKSGYVQIRFLHTRISGKVVHTGLSVGTLKVEGQHFVTHHALQINVIHIYIDFRYAGQSTVYGCYYVSFSKGKLSVGLSRATTDTQLHTHRHMANITLSVHVGHRLTGVCPVLFIAAHNA